MSTNLSSSIPVKHMRKLLLAWYDQNRRELPWRSDRDPYRVWISEVMLQQTRVAAVVDYYGRFLKRFPNIKKLAAGRESSVLAAWTGLGYYRRARMLHATAKKIVREHGGRFPETVRGLRTLPGIGRYTAAAIASIAFQQPVAVVDGNVERVLQRLTSQPLSGEQLWQTAESLLARNRPGDFNQALMELGATVCTPRQPDCSECPLARFCRSVTRTQNKSRAELAGPAKSKRVKKEIYYALASRDHSVLLNQRKRDSSLMPGLYELPQIETKGNHDLLFTVRHSITVTDYLVGVVREPAPESQGGQWVKINRLKVLPLTGLTQKILRKAGII